MQVIHIGTLVYSDPKPQTTEESRARHDAILAGLGSPINLGYATKVAHDAKSDRYTVSFRISDDKALALKATNEVAAFVAQHMSDGGGYWLGRMEDGALVDVNLIRAV